MAYHDDGLIQAVRHVTEGRRVVTRQLGLIARLKASGSATADGEQMLQTFLRSLAIFEDELHQLRNERGEKPAGTPSGT